MTGGASSQRFQRISLALAGSAVGRHRGLIRWTAVGLVMTCGVAGLAIGLRPRPLPAVSSARVNGVSIDSPGPLPGGADIGPIVATYVVDSRDPAVRLSLTGLTGPFVPGSVSVSADDGSPSSVRVTAVPDCTLDAGLDGWPAPYLLSVLERASNGRSARGQVPASRSPVDWDAAVRRSCWLSLGVHSLGIEAVQATPAPGARRVDVRVFLRNRSSRSLQIGVLDIADVATVDPADSGVLLPGDGRTFRVRVPVGACRALARPASLAWSVGPAHADPLAWLTIDLSAPQRNAIGAAVRRTCHD